MNGIILDSHDRKMALQELEEARREMLQKLSEMEQIIRDLSDKDRMIFDRAKLYWLTSIENNLSSESGSFLGSMVNFESTLEELRQHVEEVDSGAFDGMEKEEK